MRTETKLLKLLLDPLEAQVGCMMLGGGHPVRAVKWAVGCGFDGSVRGLLLLLLKCGSTQMWCMSDVVKHWNTLPIIKPGGW